LQVSDWLTPTEFAALLAAAANPRRHRPGMAERDRLVLLTLVITGLRRSELLALDWRDMTLGDWPSLLVRHGKGDRARRQALPKQLAARNAAGQRPGARAERLHTNRAMARDFATVSIPQRIGP
jgi:integrase